MNKVSFPDNPCLLTVSWHFLMISNVKWCFVQYVSDCCQLTIDWSVPDSRPQNLDKLKHITSYSQQFSERATIFTVEYILSALHLP